MTASETNLSTQYDPKQTEAKWQEYWEQQEVFKADPQHPGEPYCIVIPPPNVTGSLHMGHAFESALIDTLIRYHRMIGRNTLWLPGTDHASIAVSTIVDKQIKAEGKTRQDVGREEYLRQAWEWKEKSESTIINQLKSLGVSADWTRERFTMDEGLSQAVKTAFIQLYEAGLIYRGNYLVNWCPESLSAVSDLEAENVEVDGHLWHFRYPLSDGSGALEVATTRPETMLGDTAVAVNPNDKRYKDLIGKTITLPIVGREIPIIGDELVEMDFGTGCVKVTPAHDPNDFEMGQRHNLPFINIMNKDGSLNENAGEFEGQDRFVARQNVVKKLEELGNLVKIEDYRHSVPYSDRGKVPVEPLLSTQWFVKIEPLASKALACLDNENSPNYVPERWKKVYRDWLVKLKDWCISRQLWWGHQIPAWYVVSQTEGEIKDNTPFIVAYDEAEAKKKAIEQYGENIKLEQDPDVLDTWFSSGLWPFSTMGWPDDTVDLKTYYPTSTLVTGFDIIFFWVARMTMMAGYFTNKMPFADVYIHGLVKDENGQKMSKSKGNGIDPLILIDQYGTDALRYTLIKSVAGAGQDISLQLNRQVYELKLTLQLLDSPAAELPTILAGKLEELRTKQKSASELIKLLQKELKKQKNSDISVEDFANALRDKLNQLEEELQSKEPLSIPVEASRNFANKLWNASRFVMMNLDSKTPQALGQPGSNSLELDDKWILSRFHQTIKETRYNIEVYGLGEAAKGLYEFIWNDFCDWYIELVKSRLWQDETSPSRNVARQTLAYILEGTLKLLHPFMPHITEEIWQGLTNNLSPSPSPTRRGEKNEEEEQDVKTLALQAYPEVREDLINPQLEESFELLFGTIRTIRNLRAEAAIKPGLKIPVILQTQSDREIKILQSSTTYIQDLAKVGELSIVNDLTQEPGRVIAGVFGTIQILIPLTDVVDIATLRNKLEKNLAKVEAEIKSLTGRLNNLGFVNKAPADVVQGAKDALAEAKKQAEIISDRL
ncbi:MAG: valine--tRNA ligase, partial [Pleurocapsa sp.]